jgi:hypothetical protein
LQAHFAALDISVNARFFDINPAKAMAEITLKEWPLLKTRKAFTLCRGFG